jgi:hypothetical protein
MLGDLNIFDVLNDWYANQRKISLGVATVIKKRMKLKSQKDIYKLMNFTSGLVDFLQCIADIPENIFNTKYA